MAKKKKQTQEEQKSYEPFEGYSKTFNPTTMTNEQYLNWRQTELPYTRRPARSLIQGRNVLNDYAERLRQQRLQRESEERTQGWKKLHRDASAAGHPELAYAAKQINDTPVSAADQEKYGSSIAAKKAKLDEFIGGLAPKERTRTEQPANNYAGYKAHTQAKATGQSPILSRDEIARNYAARYADDVMADTEMQTTAADFLGGRTTTRPGTKTEPVTAPTTTAPAPKMTLGRYNDYLRSLRDEIDAGMYDNSTDPYSMSDTGLRGNINRYRNSAKEAAEQAEGIKTEFEQNRDEWKPEENWVGIFDMLEEWDEHNEEKILHGQYTPKQQANADRTLRELKQNRDSRRTEVTDKAADYFVSFFGDQWMNIWGNADDKQKEKLRGFMYDKIMPDTYADRVARMTPEQKNQFDAEFDKMLDVAIGAESRNWFDYQDEYNKYMAQKEANEKQAEKLKGEQKRRESIANLTRWAAESTQSAEYNPDLVQLKQYSPDEWNDDYYYEPEGTETDKAYYWANNVPEDLATVDPNSINKYYFIAADPDMLDTFNKLYNYDTKRTGVRSNMADQFLEALEPYLNYCMTHYQDDWFREMAEDPVRGPIARVASIPLNAVGGVTGLVGTGLAKLGVESAQDPNSPWYLTSKMVTTTRQHQNELAGDALGNLVAGWVDEKYRDQVRAAVKDGTEFGLGVVDSIVDNMFAKGVGTGLAGGDIKKTTRVIQFIMSAEATSNTMIQQLQNGKDPEEAAVYAIADGAIEWFTERVSIESWLGNDYRAMLGDKKALRKAIRNAMIAEGSEEINADVLNIGVDLVMSAVNGHETELHEKYNRLVADGMDPDEAGRRVLKDKVGEVIRSGVAGSLSGGFMVGGMYTGTAINQRQIGRQINTPNAEGQTKTEDLVGIAMETDQDSLAHRQAEEIQQQIENGEEVSNRDAGRLAQTLQQEAYEMLEKADSGEDVSPEAVEKSLNTLRSVAEILGENTQNKRADTGDKDASLQLATEDEIRTTEGERVTDGNEVITDGKFARLVSIVNETETDENGKQRTVQKYKVNIDGEERTVSAHEFRATDSRVAAVVRGQTVNPGLYSTGYTNVLLQEIEHGNVENADALRAGMQTIRLAAYTGTGMPKTDLNTETAQRLYDYSRQEFEAIRQQETAADKRNARRPGQGRVTYKGQVYGSEGFTSQVRTLSKNQRNAIGAWAEVARRAGVDVRFVDNADIEQLQKENGNFFQGTANKMYGNENAAGIMLNIEGMNYARNEQTGKYESTGERHDIGVAFGHEFTHWLQRNSVEGFNNLLNYVMSEQMKARGRGGLNARILQIMDSRHTDLAGAISELVADSCDQILANEAVIRHIEETNKGLYNEIKGFVKNLVARVKNAISNMSGSMSQDARAIIKANMQEMARLWNVAYDEAVRETKTKQAEEGETRYSYAGEDPDTGRSVYINNFAPNTEKSVKQNALISLIQDVWSKKPLSLTVRENGQERNVQAQFNPDYDPAGQRKTDVGNMTHPEFGPASRRRVILNLANDYRQILQESKYVESAPDEKGREYIHQWHYFVDDIYYAEQDSDEAIPYRIDIDIKETDDGAFVYQYRPTELKNEQRKKLSLMGLRPVNTGVMSGESASASENNITQKNGKGNTRYSIADENKRLELQGAADRHIKLNIEARNAIFAKYGIGENDIMFGVEFMDDGKVDWAAHDDAEKKLIRRISKADLQELFKLSQDSEKWRQTWNENAVLDTEDYYENAREYEATKDSVFYRVDPIEKYAAKVKRYGRIAVLDTEAYADLDQKYADAVARKDWRMAEQMLLDKYQKMEKDGLIGYNANYFHNGDHAEIARAIKTGSPEAIRQAAEEMALKVPDNAILIPMPPHSGTVTDSTDTMILAKAIAEITGSPVATALESDEHISRNKAKTEGIRGVNAESMGFRVSSNYRFGMIRNGQWVFVDGFSTIPDSKMPIFIDNVVGGGVTAQAAHDAVGRGITLAYAQSSRSKIRGAKYLSVTYDSEGKLIPLSQRMDINNPSWKYSQAEETDQRQQELSQRFDVSKRDVRYSRAQVDSDGRELSEGQKEYFGNSKVVDSEGRLLRMYHGTNADFTEFDREMIGSTGRFEGSGFNFTPAEGRASSYGKNVMNGYLNIVNPLSSEKKTISVAQLARLIRMADPTGDNIIADYARETRDYGSDSFVRRESMTAARNVWEASDNDVDIYSFISAADSDAVNLINVFESLGYDGLIHYNDDGKIKTAVAFSSEQFKNVDNLNPTSNPDVRFSRWTEESMDVNAWLAGQTYSSFRTDDERAMWKEWSTLRTNMQLALMAQEKYRQQIRQLEAKDILTPEEQKQLENLRKLQEKWSAKLAEHEDRMRKITTNEGWAAMMRRSNMVISDFVAGKTQEQVQAAIDTMTNEIQEADKEIRKQESELKKLEDTSAVKTIRRLLGSRGLTRTADTLRSQYNTAMSREELENRLAEIVLRSANGEDVTADVESLANDVVTNQVGYGNEVAQEALSALRGMTIEIGPGAQAELKANHSSLKDIRTRTRGSGIKFVYGQASTLDTDAEEIYQAVPALRGQLENEKAGLENFVSYVESLLNMKTEQGEDTGIDRNEVEAFIGAMANVMLRENVGGMNRNTLLAKIQDEAGRIAKALEAVRGVRENLKGVMATGMKAQNWAGILKQDMDTAMDYYNKMAKLAAQTERKKVKEVVIAQLKNENTRKLIEQQQKYEELIKNDRKARELAEDNLQLRSQIHTVANRIATRMFAETDQKNVPEEAKPLARKVLEMLNNHDSIYRHVTFFNKKQRNDISQRLLKMVATSGAFNADTDLNWLVINPGPDADTSLQEKVIQDLIDIETGLLEYRTAEGQKNISLQDRRNALEKVQEAVSEIWSAINARSQAEINGRKWQVYELAEVMRNDMANSRFKGERTGFGAKARNTLSGAVNYGNLTPEYFFKNLKNRAIDILHNGLKEGENKNGLEAAKAKARLARIAEETGFRKWDGQEKHKVQTSSGVIEMTTEQIMSLYATWMRESNQLRPAETAHLLHGGFVLRENEEGGKPGRKKTQQRPIRMSADHLNALAGYLTEEQKNYVEAVVEYMSGELAELGNEASMKMYGIKKYTEQYYFPIKSWGGVLNSRSDAGVNSNNENRAAQQGFSKRVRNDARNAIEIGDFTQTAVKHVAGMITYNTVGPAIENMNKVLNQQLEYGEKEYNDAGEVIEDDTYKRNMRAAFQEAYGKQAMDYLAKFMKDMNGGVTTEQTPFDKLLSIFKKNAVAGSLSVAAQQPLSYIRAAMMISPKYLAAAISPQYWKGSYAEMMKHSGLAVIKEMGKFDMNFGQTMQDWIMPEGMKKTGQRIWNGVTDFMTAGPQKMDAMTWTRMWTAVKLEQMAQNKGMDFTGEAFMKKVTERFNDLIRKTQVYDSVMTKSQNMRSKHFYAKTLTSFMAEPTLSLNVLEDAWQNRKAAGGKAAVIKSVAAFLLSAAAQAGAKAFFGTGRSPDKKKNKEENFLNKFGYNLLSEVNPLGLIPGYRQIIETMTEGELKDDTMGMIGKAVDVVDKIFALATGDVGKKGLYRDLEDSIGQLLQLTTDIPAKNLMRDFRAMVNFFSGGGASDFTGDTYANRPTSSAMLKYQAWDTLMSEDLIGMINKRLGEAGYMTDAKHYYPRIYEAEKSGNQKAADEMKEYLILKSTAEDPEKSINDGLKALAKKDDTISEEERTEYVISTSTDKGGSDYVIAQLKEGKITAEEARRQLKKIYPDKDDDKIWWQVDRAEYAAQTGTKLSSNDMYYRLEDAIAGNKSDEIKATVSLLVSHGVTKERIIGKLSDYKSVYLNATGAEKTRLKDALTKAFKACGMSAQEAVAKIDGWTKTTKKK